MEIKLRQDTLQEWIKMYYKKYNGIDIEARIVLKRKHRSYEDDYCEVGATIFEEIEIFGKKYTISEEIAKDFIENICRIILNETNYELESLYFNVTDSDIGNNYELKEAVLHLKRKTLTTTNMTLDRKNKI